MNIVLCENMNQLHGIEHLFFACGKLSIHCEIANHSLSAVSFPHIQCFGNAFLVRCWEMLNIGCVRFKTLHA